MQLGKWFCGYHFREFHLYDLLPCVVHVRCDVDAYVVLTFSYSLSLDRTYGRIGESSNEEGYYSFIRARAFAWDAYIYSV
jgi:hypothetical protein